MPLTQPFPHEKPNHKLSDTDLAKAIRLDLEAEMDAINLYTSHMEATDNKEAQKILAHVIKEEKDHAVLFLELIKRLDSQQKQLLDESKEYFDAALKNKEAMLKRAMGFDIDKALQEIQEKDSAEIDIATAYSWGSRALAAYKLYDETKELKWLLAAEEYGNEAIEHAALAKNKGKTLKAIENAIGKARKKFDIRNVKLARLFHKG